MLRCAAVVGVVALPARERGIYRLWRNAVFFDRSGNKPQSSVSEQPKTPDARAAAPRRNWAALGLAAAMAAPFGVVQLSQLQAQDAKPEQLAGPTPTNADLVRQARQEFQHRQFEQAEKTIAAVKADALSERDREAYLTLASDVKHAAIECRAAREDLLNGEDALKGQQELDAIARFKSVALNQFADVTTVKKAKARLILLDKSSAAGDPVAETASDLSPQNRYELGLSQYRSGNWNDARHNLQVAQAAGYKPASLYQDPPAAIIARIDARQQSNQDRERVQKLAQAAAPQNNTNTGNDPLAALRATDDAEK